MNFKGVSDRELLERTEKLVEKERELLTEILRHLREIQRRRLYSDLGYASLWDYCAHHLKYSNAQIQRRIAAMDVIAEFPEVEKKVENGELSLTNVANAKTFFRQEEKNAPLNSQEKLAILSGLENKSSRDGEKFLLSQSSYEVKPVVEKIRQVTEDLTEVKFAADEKLLAKMERLRGLLAHKKGHMNIAELFNEACEMALNQIDPLRKKSTEKKVTQQSRPAPEVTTRQYISVKVKRDVWESTDGKCAICGSQYALEIDHKTPVSMGGGNGKENLRLLCRSCNQRAAIKELGSEKMGRYLT